MTPLSREGAAIVAAEVARIGTEPAPTAYADLTAEQRDEIERHVLDVLASGPKHPEAVREDVAKALLWRVSAAAIGRVAFSMVERGAIAVERGRWRAAPRR